MPITTPRKLEHYSPGARCPSAVVARLTDARKAARSRSRGTLVSIPVRGEEEGDQRPASCALARACAPIPRLRRLRGSSGSAPTPQISISGTPPSWLACPSFEAAALFGRLLLLNEPQQHTRSGEKGRGMRKPIYLAGFSDHLPRRRSTTPTRSGEEKNNLEARLTLPLQRASVGAMLRGSGRGRAAKAAVPPPTSSR